MPREMTLTDLLLSLTRKPAAAWVSRGGKLIGLLLPDSYGKPIMHGRGEIMSWGPDKVSALRATVPTVELL